MKNTLHFLTTSTAAGLETATSTFRHVIYGVLATGITVSLLLAFSIFAYVAFYFAYVPAPIFRGLAHLVFEPCAETLGRCGYLNASVDLTVKPGGEYANGILMAGQPYLVAVELEMPESPPNWQVGMFMSCLQLRTRQGKTIKDNCRSTMLQYRSELLRIMETFVFAPFLLSGHSTEKQRLYLEFFNHFYDDPLNPAVKLDYQILSRFVEIYSVEYFIYANFQGFRYLMFHYPLTSAIVGCSTNFVFLAVVVLLFWSRVFSKEVPQTDEDGGNYYEEGFKDKKESRESHGIQAIEEDSLKSTKSSTKDNSDPPEPLSSGRAGVQSLKQREEEAHEGEALETTDDRDGQI